MKRDHGVLQSGLQTRTSVFEKGSRREAYENAERTDESGTFLAMRRLLSASRLPLPSRGDVGLILRDLRPKEVDVRNNQIVVSAEIRREETAT